MLKNFNDLIIDAEKELDRLFPTRSIKRVLLVSPPDADESMFNYDIAKRGRYWNFPLYGLGVIAVHLKGLGIEVCIVNLNHEILKTCMHTFDEASFDFDASWENIIENKITSFCPDLIGLTCMFSQTHTSLVKLCNKVKKFKPGLPMALGGVHITSCFLDDTTSGQLLNDLNSCDLFFLYEAELAFNNFIKVVNQEISAAYLSQIYFNKSTDKLFFPNTIIPNENEINVLPAHDQITPVDLAEYGKIGSFFCHKDKTTRFSTLISNRGCRGQCAFCSVRNFNGAGVRHRSVQSIIDELKMLRDEYGIGHIMWLDDDLLHDTKKTLALFSEMSRQNIGITWDCTNGVIAASCTEEIIAAAAECGCIGLTIGVESGNPEILKRIKKPGNVNVFLKAAEVLGKYEQINSRVFLMVGFPGETYQMILDTVNLAVMMDLDWYNITIFQPLPNTSMFDSMVNDGLVDNIEFDHIRYSAGPYGKVREKAQKNLFSPGCKKNFFHNFNPGQVPLSSLMDEIWFQMNYHLNFQQLNKKYSSVKLQQQYRYVKNIAEIVAPDDAFAMYFYGYLQHKLHGRISDELTNKLVHRIRTSDYWKQRFKEFNLSENHLKTASFPDEF